MSFSYSIVARKTLRKGTVYDARFRVIDGRGIEVQKRLCGFKTKGEAKKAAIKFLSSYVPPTLPPTSIDQTEKIPFEKALAAYLTFDRAQTKESTQYEKVRLFAKHITPYFKGRDIRAITKADVAAWQDALWAATNPRTGKPFATVYVRKVRANCQRLFKWCAERYDTQNPFVTLSAPKRREAKRELEFYEVEEFNRLIGVIDEVLWRTVFMFLFYTGCRVGEMQALSESDITPQGVRINKTYTKKTMDGTPYKITDTKNYKNRVVPIPEVLRTALSAYFAWKRTNNIAADFLFGGDRPIALQTIRNHLDRYTALSGVKRIRIHGFRHSYVSMCAHLGATPVIIATLIGDTIETVNEVYTHIWAQDTRELVSKINDICASFVPH